MINFETNTPYVALFAGGGTAGTTAAGFLSAVEAGHVDGVKAVEVLAAVNTCDDGSSTGRVRKFYQTPPVGDGRRSISALSSSREAAAHFERRFDTTSSLSDVDERTDELFAALSNSDYDVSSSTASRIKEQTMDVAEGLYGYTEEQLNGMALGHLVVTGMYLYNKDKSIDGAFEEAGKLMAVRGQVIATSDENHWLLMKDGTHLPYQPGTLGSQKRIIGEHLIDTYTPLYPDNVEVMLYPYDTSHKVRISERAERAIDTADQVVLGPGSVYTSIIPSILPEGMKPALQRMQDEGRKLTLMGNLVTGAETRGWTGRKYVEELEKYTGRRFDRIVINRNTDPLTDAVVFDRAFVEEAGDRITATDLVFDKVIVRDEADPLKDSRTEVEHNPINMARALLNGQVVRGNSQLASV